MKNYLSLLAVVMAASVFGQPQIPPANLYPVTANSIIGNIGPAGRGEAIPLGAGLAFSGGALVATGGGGGSGTVTSIPDGTSNGVAWTVANRTTTPTFTFTLGAITPTSIVASSTITGSNLSGTNTGDQNLWRNIVVSGQDTVVPVTTTSSLTLAAGANITLTTNNTTKTITIAAAGAGSGNVTNNATLASGNVILGGGTTVVGTSNISTTGGNNMAIPGNVTIGGDLAVTGNQTVGNLTTTNLTISGTITGVVGVANGGTGLATITANSIVIGNGTNSPILLAPGTSGNVVTSNGTAWTSAPASGGGSLTLKQWTALDNQPPAVSFSTPDTRNSIALQSHIDGADTYSIFVANMPEGTSLATGIRVIVKWTAGNATSGDCVWVFSWMRCDSTTDIDTDSYATGISETTTTSGTSGIPNTTNIDFNGTTDIDGVVVGDMFRLRGMRDGDAGADTMTDTAQILSVEIQQR